MEDFTLFAFQGQNCHNSHINISTTMDTRFSKLVCLPLELTQIPTLSLLGKKITKNSDELASNLERKAQINFLSTKSLKVKKIIKKRVTKRKKKIIKKDKPKITLDKFFALSRQNENEKLNLNNLNTKENDIINQNRSIFHTRNRHLRSPPARKIINNLSNFQSPPNLMIQANIDQNHLRNENEHQKLLSHETGFEGKVSAESLKKNTNQTLDRCTFNQDNHKKIENKMEEESFENTPRFPNPFQFNVLPIQKQKLRNYELSQQKKISAKEIETLEIELARRFKIHKALGKGSFATVFLATDQANNAKVAIKVYKNNIPEAKKQSDIIQNEIKILKTLNDPKILKFLGNVQNSNYFVLILELVEGITLSTFLHKSHRKQLSESTALQIIRQIVDCLAICHSRKIYHRDIKLSNIMIKKNLDIVLIDFGFAVQNLKNEFVNNFCGTLNYIAPELLRSKPYKPGPVDVWALGILFFKLLTGEYPFKGLIKNG